MVNGGNNWFISKCLNIDAKDGYLWYDDHAIIPAEDNIGGWCDLKKTDSGRWCLSRSTYSETMIYVCPVDTQILLYDGAILNILEIINGVAVFTISGNHTVYDKTEVFVFIADRMVISDVCSIDKYGESMSRDLSYVFKYNKLKNMYTIKPSDPYISHYKHIPSLSWEYDKTVCYELSADDIF